MGSNNFGPSNCLLNFVPDLLDAVHAAAGAVRAHAEVLAEGGVHEERGEPLHQPAPDLTGQLQVAFLHIRRWELYKVAQLLRERNMLTPNLKLRLAVSLSSDRLTQATNGT